MVRGVGMSELQSPGTSREARGEARASARTRRPPRVDERLDDWLARRLEARGIRPRRRRRLPMARMLAVVGLLAAMGGVGWAVTSSTSQSTPAATGKGTTTAHKRSAAHSRRANRAGSSGARKPVPISWRSVTVDVLNGYGVGGAASHAAAALKATGWKVGEVGDAGRDTARTLVVYAPGDRRKARVVARRLHLGAPKPIAAAPGVPEGATSGVAVVLGADGLSLP